MKKSFIILLVALTATLIGSGFLSADPEGMVTDRFLAVNNSDLVWKEAPKALPPGAKLAVVHGDPTKSGLFAMRIMAPGGYQIPPHWHPADEHVTVISGTLFMGHGSKFDKSKGHKLKAGGFARMKKGTRHYAWTKGKTVVQVHAMGPWGINYVNPSDDPRKAK